MEPRQYPHRRFNPLTGEWVPVSPHRLLRPWQGKVERPPENRRPRYDPDCYLCPGNTRAGSARNPVYEKELAQQRSYRERHGSSLLLDYLAQEQQRNQRIV